MPSIGVQPKDGWLFVVSFSGVSFQRGAAGGTGSLLPQNSAAWFREQTLYFSTAS